MSTEDDSFHPLGEEWEEQMRENLDETEYDTELGMQMAEDAMRLVQGEITEDAFQQKYHDAVVEEFEVEEDQLPDALANETDEGCDDDSCGCSENTGVVEQLTGIDDFDDEESRREVMKKMGLGAAAMGVGGSVVASGGEDDGGTGVGAGEGQDDDEGDTQWGMVIDLERCDGCLECVVGCQEENNWDLGANWMYVLTYEDGLTDEQNFLVRPCQHCSNAPCEKVCPVEARHTRLEDGLVLTDYEICIGCRYCQVACPYGVNYFGWGDPETPDEDLQRTEESGSDLRDMSEGERQEVLEDATDHVFDKRGREVDSRPRKGTMGKCTMCPSRQDGHLEDAGHDRGTVACMDACDTAGMSAIHFGDMNDPTSRPNQYLERRKQETQENGTAQWVDADDEDAEEWETSTTPWTGKLSAFKLLEEMGTDPNITYLGNEPGPEAEQVEGPIRYDQVFNEDGEAMVDNRKDRLDEKTLLGGN